jgi:hypothetical protein
MFVDKEPENKQTNTATAGDNGVAVAGNENKVEVPERSQVCSTQNSEPKGQGQSADIDLGSAGKFSLPLSQLFSADDVAQIILTITNATLGGPIAGVATYSFFNYLVPNSERAGAWIQQNIGNVWARLKGRLKKKGVTATRPLPPAFAAEAAKTIALEDNTELQDTWATLLANAMDPNFDINTIHPSFLGIIKAITPLEVQFLHNIYQALLEKGIWGDTEKCLNARVNFTKVVFQPGVTPLILQTAIDDLERNKLVTTLQILKDQYLQGEASLDGVASRQNGPALTTLGIMFIQACIK